MNELERQSDISDEKQKTWLFQKGQSGNPAGRPKGKFSIKSKIIQRLEESPQELEELINYLIKNQQSLIFQMVDGRPKQGPKEDVDVLPVPILINLPLELAEKNRLIQLLDRG